MSVETVFSYPKFKVGTPVLYLDISGKLVRGVIVALPRRQPREEQRLGQGDLPSARALEEQVLSTRRRVLGERHPDTTVSAWNLVTTLHRIGESESAARILRECLARLVSVDAASLSAAQREIRGRVAVILRRDSQA